MAAETAPNADETRVLVVDVPANDEEVNDEEVNDEEADNEKENDEEVSEKAASVSSSPAGSGIDDDEEPHTDYSHPTGDLHQLGLEVVAGDANPEDVSYDVVGVHGLHSWSRSAWMKHPRSLQYKSWLSNKFSGMPGHSGRVMLYGYDPGYRSDRTWTSYGIYREAKVLLEALLELRRPEITEKRRPIWFLSHDIGGVIVKAAMVLATRRESKYGDILHCTRSLVFFGYPHRYGTRHRLEESISRLLHCMQWKPYIDNSLWVVKSLSQALHEVNDAFIHTPLPTQVNLVNVSSTRQVQPFVFNDFMTTMYNPFEHRLWINKPNHLLVTENLGTAHEFCQVPNLDWISGDLLDHLHPTLRQLINQASPIYPYMKSETNLLGAFPELEGFTKSSDDRIVHLRCAPSSSVTTARASERARMFLETKRTESQPLLYFKFDAHDVRFSDASAMLRTFIARLLFNRLKDCEVAIQRVTERLHLSGVMTPYSLFYEFDYLRLQSNFDESVYVLGCLDECDESSLWFLSRLREYVERTESNLRLLITTTYGTDKDDAVAFKLSQFPPGVVTSVKYEPPQPQSCDFKRDASLLVQERPEFAWNDRQDAIRDLLSKCKFDEDLYKLLIDWLESAPQPFESSARLFDECLSPELVFEIVLAETPENRKVWAQKLLSWVLTSLRPLRTNEFCRISDEVWLQVGGEGKHREPVREYDAWSRVADVLGYFGGLLVIEQGEIRFRHPNTRDWLLSQESAENTGVWYRQGSEEERHGIVLETCLSYLCGEPEEDATLWAEQIPYAIEFWTRHYQQATPTKNITDGLFEVQSLLQRWIDAYRASPTPFLKPRLETMMPLPVAAHFGLQEVVQSLLAKPQSDIKVRDQSLIEAARVGNLDIVNLIMDSYPSGFHFDDDHLHEAVRAASFCGHPGVFRKLVDTIPAPSYTIPQRSSLDRPSNEPTGNNGNSRIPESRDQEAESPNDDSDESQDSQGNNTNHNSLDEASKPEKPHDPFHWLSVPLVQASHLGLDDIIIKLLSVGADPNPPQGEYLIDKSPLHMSADHGHVSSIGLLIEGGANVNTRGLSGTSPLFLASSPLTATTLLDHGASIDLKMSDDSMILPTLAEWGDYAVLESLLQHRDYHEYLEEGPSHHPVNIAAEFGRRKCLKALLRHGFSSNIPDPKGKTALWWAIANEDIDQCRLLLENGADPDLTPEGAEPPLHKSVFMNRLDIMQLLVEHKADIEKKEMPGAGWLRTPLHAAVDYERNDQIEYLLKQGAHPNVQDSANLSPIFIAAQNGRTDVVRMLAEAKAEVNSLSDIEQWTPAHAAYKFPETVELLMDLGADMTILTKSSYTPLDLALANGQRATIDMILSKSKTKFDFTLRGTQMAMVDAVIGGHTEAIDAMLEAGADVNTVDADHQYDKNGPLLSQAMELGDEAMMRKLLEFRPELELTSEQQNTAAHCISSKTPVASVRLFVNAGGKLDVLNKDRETPLQIAADRGNEDVFKYMLAKEAALSVLHVTPRDQVGTVMHVACRRGYLEMVRLLIQHNFNVNFVCDDFWGSPLISALIGPAEQAQRGQMKDILELLLKEGADPSLPAGFLGYPIIAGCLASPSEIVQLLLDRDVSIDVKDPFSRKPVHMACYNSLQVLNLLNFPDRDFAAQDAVGRVPLHYAVVSGQPDLVEEVLARSRRVGIDINVKDNDGWTPLFWAARNSPPWRRSHETDLTATDVVSLLLDEGADPAIEGLGFSAPVPCSASQIAYYCQADAIGDMITAKSGKSSSAVKKRGKQSSDSSCECCLLNVVGIHSTCDDCYDFGLCFKCSKSKYKFHPRHSFREEGEEWEDKEKDADDKAEALAEAPGEVSGNSNDNEATGLDDGSNSEEFDDEIVG